MAAIIEFFRSIIVYIESSAGGKFDKFAAPFIELFLDFFFTFE